mgnify:CR=1 FL=1
MTIYQHFTFYFPQLFAKMAMYIDTMSKNTVMNLITKPPSLKSTSKADSDKLSLRQVNTRTWVYVSAQIYLCIYMYMYI